MSLKDIEKLKEKVEKDSNSKLFVPLAEEYRKEGMLDDAINVLLNGIEKQPGYMSAKVSLGKIYLEKGMLKEARAEFENVIKSIPDNLFAQKKLAEIYRDSGEKDMAIKSFRNVLRLNPMDEDALNKLREVEGKEFVQQVSVKPDEVKLPSAKEVLAPEEDVREMDFTDKEETALPEEIKAETVHDEELTAFKNSVTGNKQNVSEELPQEISVQEDEDIEILDDNFIDDEEEISFGDIVESLKTEKSAIKDKTEEKLGLKEITEKDFKELSGKVVTFVEDADKCISKGDYIGAMDIYKSILLKSPGDKRILQRIEELKSLLKLSGKDNEVLIKKLNAFVEGINKRRDEFSRSS